MYKDKLLIVGASGHGKVIADIAVKLGLWESIEFLDDDLTKTAIMGFSVIGQTSLAFTLMDEYDIFVAIGNNVIRERIQESLLLKGANIPTLVHPNAVIGMDVTMGVGTVVMGGCVINPSTKIGNGCIINTGTTLDHDNTIGDYVHISPGVHLAGTVTVGKASWLGIGTIVKNNLVIGKNVITGAGAVVVKDIEEAGTYVGVPALIINR